MQHRNHPMSPDPSREPADGSDASLLATQRRIRPIHPAYETDTLCPTCNRVLIRIGGGSVVSCHLGHLFSYPDMTPLGGA
jgi:hypothetical protein